jgi:hypothetical protein
VDYRFYEGQVFQVLDYDRLVLYVQDYSDAESFPLQHYFFSPDAGAPVQPLSLPALQRAYADHPAMRNALQQVKLPYRWEQPVFPHNRPHLLEL